MKKLLANLILILLMTICCCIAEEEENFFIVSYDGNGMSLSTAFTPQAKIPGTSLTLNDSQPLRNFYTFGGWAESPDALLPDYLPGDSYTRDQDVTLYAVWLEPASLGEISGPCTWTLDPYPYTRSTAYREFSVSESGFYRFFTSGGTSGAVSPYIVIKNSNGLPNSIASGDSSYVSGIGWDFDITAELQAGTTYYLKYSESGMPLALEALPQYSDPDPYGAVAIIPRSISTLEEDAFANTALDSFFCPPSVTKIDKNTFADCPNLHKIVISGMQVDIDPEAFAGCTELLIVAPKDSTAHQFALAYGHEFRALPQN